MEANFTHLTRMDAAVEATVEAAPKVDGGRCQVGHQKAGLSIGAVQRVQILVQTRPHLAPERVRPLRQLEFIG